MNSTEEEKEKRIQELEEGLAELGMKLVRGKLDRIYELAPSQKLELGIEVNRRRPDHIGKSISEIEDIYLEVAEDLGFISRIQ